MFVRSIPVWLSEILNFSLAESLSQFMMKIQAPTTGFVEKGLARLMSGGPQVLDLIAL